MVSYESNSVTKQFDKIEHAPVPILNFTVHAPCVCRICETPFREISEECISVVGYKM